MYYCRTKFHFYLKSYNLFCDIKFKSQLINHQLTLIILKIFNEMRGNFFINNSKFNLNL